MLLLQTLLHEAISKPPCPPNVKSEEAVGSE
jgi:hypothetical protein